MKMKQVCEETGLTEKAVRLYMQHALVHPAVTEGLHNQSFDFSGEDIQQLKIVAAFRAAGFSMADIREIQLHPEQLPAFLEEHRAMMESDIHQKKRIVEALDRLSAAETGSLDAVANAMRPAQRQDLEQSGSNLLPVLILGAAVLLVIWLGFREASQNTSRDAMIFGAFFLGALAGLGCILMSIRYVTCPARATRLHNRAVGTVISVTKQTGFDGSFAMQSTATAGAPRWGGSGGLWALFFMLWGEIRPDHWVPVIQFTDSTGKLRSGTYPYGGLKFQFQEGTQLEIAWEKYPQQVLPLRAPWLFWKAAVYFAVGAALLIPCLAAIIRIFPTLIVV